MMCASYSPQCSAVQRCAAKTSASVAKTAMDSTWTPEVHQMTAIVFFSDFGQRVFIVLGVHVLLTDQL